MIASFKFAFELCFAFSFEPPNIIVKVLYEKVFLFLFFKNYVPSVKFSCGFRITYISCSSDTVLEALAKIKGVSDAKTIFAWNKSAGLFGCV
jgi:hypothetical protein